MQKIGGFFNNFNNKITRQLQNLVFIMEIIKKHTGIELEMKQISISNGVLKIKTSSLEKNEIFMKKTKVLKDLEGKLHGIILRDIN
jgi:uncharacterized protein (UPF0210 family)